MTSLGYTIICVVRKNKICIILLLCRIYLNNFFNHHVKQILAPLTVCFVRCLGNYWQLHHIHVRYSFKSFQSSGSVSQPQTVLFVSIFLGDRSFLGAPRMSHTWTGTRRSNPALWIKVSF